MDGKCLGRPLTSANTAADRAGVGSEWPTLGWAAHFSEQYLSNLLLNPPSPSPPALRCSLDRYRRAESWLWVTLVPYSHQTSSEHLAELEKVQEYFQMPPKFPFNWFSKCPNLFQPWTLSSALAKIRKQWVWRTWFLTGSFWGRHQWRHFASRVLA